MESTTIAMLGMTGASALSSLFGKKKKTSQEPLETPEQAEARRRLLEFSRTGKWGNFEAGAEVPLGYGDFGVTDIEESGMAGLRGLLDSGIPDQFRLGDAALADLLETNPARIEAQFQPVKDLVARQKRESNDDLKRTAGFAGNLYSTDTVRNLGDIEARANETLTANLANLTNEALNRRLQAVPLAYQAGEATETIRRGRIGDAFAYGGLTRQLNDASIKARDAEILRRRAELKMPIDAATTVAGGPPQYGIPSVETSPYQELLNMAGQIGGNFVGNELYLGQYKRHFPTGAPRAV